MNLMTAVRISAAGLSAERTRVNVASMNLANAHVTRTVDGGPYKPKSVVFKAVPMDQPGPFSQALDRNMGAIESVTVDKVVDDPDPFVQVYDPSHPDADENGMVLMPNVNVMEQMVDLMSAQRAYEAGVTAIGTAKAMTAKALEIGR